MISLTGFASLADGSAQIAQGDCQAPWQKTLTGSFLLL